MNMCVVAMGGRVPAMTWWLLLKKNLRIARVQGEPPRWISGALISPTRP